MSSPAAAASAVTQLSGSALVAARLARKAARAEMIAKRVIEKGGCINQTENQTKWRILVLHGYAQNASVIRGRTGALRRVLKQVADFDYCDAPHRVALEPRLNGATPSSTSTSTSTSTTPSSTSTSTSTSASSSTSTDGTKPSLVITSPPTPPDAFAWWLWDPTTPNVAEGWKTSVDYIRNIWLTQGPYDGVFCFSQGAGFGSLLCALYHHSPQHYPWLSSLRCAILVSGFIPRATEKQIYYQDKIAIPSLHIIGRTDAIVEPERNEALAERFVNAELLYHDGGHYIPVDAENCRKYLTFIQQIPRPSMEEKDIDAVTSTSATSTTDTITPPTSTSSTSSFDTSNSTRSTSPRSNDMNRPLSSL